MMKRSDSTQRPPTRTGPVAAALALLPMVLLALPGCARYHDYDAFLRNPKPLVTTSDYRMMPPDVVQVSSKRVREIDGHQEQIRPDGRLTLPLLGSIFVAGRTTEDVALELEDLARDFYEDADVTVRVIGYNSKKIFVFGEVSGPGPYSYNGANTILGTLSKAQPTRLADPTRIHILRPGEDGYLVRRMTISLDRMIQQGDTTLDAVLEDGDIIFVPANPLAAVGLGLQQLLLPIQPAASVVAGPAGIDDDMQRSPYKERPSDGGAP